LSPSNFKSYEELKAKLNSVLELGGVSAPAAPRQASATKSMVENDVDESPFVEDEDDELKQFKALAQG
jgi:hypothetical protein